MLLPSLGWKRGPEGSGPGYLREKGAALKSKLKIHKCAGISRGAVGFGHQKLAGLIQKGVQKHCACAGHVEDRPSTGETPGERKSPCPAPLFNPRRLNTPTLPRQDISHMLEHSLESTGLGVAENRKQFHLKDQNKDKRGIISFGVMPSSQP